MRLLRTVGLAEKALNYPDELSGGQKQRIAIAGILALHPKILVLDEATAMLDPSGRKDLLDTVESLHKTGMTILMVTQYMEETTACDRIIVMHNGNVVLDDSPSVVFSQTEVLQRSNLIPPEIIRIRNQLNAQGLYIPDSVLTAEQLAEAICPL